MIAIIEIFKGDNVPFCSLLVGTDLSPVLVQMASTHPMTWWLFYRNTKERSLFVSFHVDTEDTVNDICSIVCIFNIDDAENY